MPSKGINFGGKKGDDSSNAPSKGLKISKAQEYVMLAVLLTSLLLGFTFAMGKHMIESISFNKDVISEKDTAVRNYSDTIKNVGVCVAPSGAVYSDSELENCNPDEVSVDSISGTLKYNILNNLAANDSLNAVPKDSDTSCINTATGKNYTYKELMEEYNNASDDSKSAASQKMKTCSALRIVPDALPSYRNEEALLASLNKIFNITEITPESLTPGDSGDEDDVPEDLLGINVNLNVEQNMALTQAFLKNLDKSIREFNISRATFEWSSNEDGTEGLEFSATATAYYVAQGGLSTDTVTVDPENGVSRSSDTLNTEMEE